MKFKKIHSGLIALGLCCSLFLQTPVLVLIYNPFKAAILLFRVLGVVLILSGAGDCFSTIYFARKLRRFKQEQDALDSTFEEVDPKDQN